ncbi:uncharacterized protein, partial [Melanerpes formicivorus]|uniref:uncharacterized protein n=1 Tax=Melanerpes formicivorus TaxID=211600 RepID=UPI00359013EB
STLDASRPLKSGGSTDQEGIKSLKTSHKSLVRKGGKLSAETRKTCSRLLGNSPTSSFTEVRSVSEDRGGTPLRRAAGPAEAQDLSGRPLRGFSGRALLTQSDHPRKRQEPSGRKRTAVRGKGRRRLKLPAAAHPRGPPRRGEANRGERDRTEPARGSPRRGGRNRTGAGLPETRRGERSRHVGGLAGLSSSLRFFPVSSGSLPGFLNTHRFRRRVGFSRNGKPSERRPAGRFPRAAARDAPRTAQRKSAAFNRFPF